MFTEALREAFFDSLQMLPFLFADFLILEAVEHYSSGFMKKALYKVGKAGPVAGSVLGCIPQCGFSVIAANLYSGGIITLGTLLAVFIATSDEAILILMGNPGRGTDILNLIITKIIIAVVAGYGVDIFFRSRSEGKKEIGEICDHCGCHEGHGGILMPAMRHTAKIFLYVLVFNLVLEVALDWIGAQRLSEYLLKDSLIQPFIAALIGMIPNCASSVILTELYLSGAISFASVVSGLCTGAGIGLVVLLKMNHNPKENLKIVGLLYGISVVAGVVIQVFGGLF